MPQIVNYLHFNGTCAEAMRHYERVLGGKLTALMSNGQSPIAEHIPPGNEDRILHACLELGDGVSLYAGDSMAGQPYEGMKGFSLSLNYPTAAEAQRVFDALCEGGQVTMPFSEAFWADGFGMVVDRYGTPWIVNGGMRELPQQ